MNKDLKLTPGDIILVKGDSKISGAIEFFMNVYRKRKGLPKRRVYTHSMTVINIWDELYVGEALADGFNINALYSIDLDDVKILTPKRKYSKLEQRTISRVAANLSFDPTRYNYFALLSQVNYILTGKWIGKKGKNAEKRMYCTEATAVLANAVRPKTFDKPYAVNPLDIELNKYYIVKHDPDSL